MLDIKERIAKAKQKRQARKEGKELKKATGKNLVMGFTFAAAAFSPASMKVFGGDGNRDNSNALTSFVGVIQESNQDALQNYEEIAKVVVEADKEKFLSELYNRYNNENFSKFQKQKFYYCMHVPTHTLKDMGSRDSIAYINELIKVPVLDGCLGFTSHMSKKYPGKVTNPDTRAKKKINPHDIEIGDILVIGNGGRTETGDHAVTKVGEVHDKNGELVATKILSFNNEYEAYYVVPGKKWEEAVDIPEEDKQKTLTSRGYVSKGEIGIRTSPLVATHVKLNEIMRTAFQDEIKKIGMDKDKEVSEYVRSQLERVGKLDEYLAQASGTKTGAFEQDALTAQNVSKNMSRDDR